MKRLLFMVLGMIMALSIKAQDTEEQTVAADRPGMATGVGVMPFKSVQWESGMEFGLKDNKQMTMPTTMMRFGITHFAELRLEYDGTLAKEDGEWGYHAEPLIMGTKLKVFDGYKWVPKVSLMANFAFPCTKQQADELHVAPSVYALFQNDVCDWFNIGYNLGAEWNGQDATPSTFLAVCFGFTITDKLGAYAETYNYFSRPERHKHDVSNGIDFGFNYLVNNRIQLDLYAGFTCQHPKENGYIGLGVAWLIK